MPVSASFSRSALNLAANARTGLSGLVCAAFVLATMLFLTPLLHHLPKPVLAAMIIVAVLGLVDVPGMRHAWQASRDDGIAGTATFFATLAFAPNIQDGILAGILLSLAASSIAGCARGSSSSACTPTERCATSHGSRYRRCIRR